MFNFVVMENIGSHLSEENISLAVDNLLFPGKQSLPNFISNHLDECTHCKMLVLENYETLKEVEKIYLSSSENSQTEFKTSKSFFYKVAAILVLFIISSVLLYYFFLYDKGLKPIKISNTTQLKSKDTVTIKDSVKEIVKDNNQLNKQIALNQKTAFEPSLNLESIVKANFRSKSITTLSPGNGKNFKLKQSIPFSFKSNGEQNSILKIIDNKENVIFSVPLQSEFYTFQNNLPSGLYYWKLENSDELLTAGKFTVK